MSFETNPKDLQDLLREAHEGRLQLPDFQRSYVWAEEDVRGLIASIARGFPVGALLTLESGGDVRFKPRLLEGVPEVDRKPDQLLLDGQQRITSLYGALWSREPMLTKLRRDQRSAVRRLFYIDIRAAVGQTTDIEDAVLALRDDRTLREDFRVKLDLSTQEDEFREHCFPLHLCFDRSGERSWFRDWRRHWEAKGDDITALEDEFVKRVLNPIQTYKMPVIKLSRESSREAICLIFEKVNVGGKKLDAFELVTAIFAGSSEPLDLRRDWYGDTKAGVVGRLQRIVHGRTGTGHRQDVLAEVKTTDFLQAVSLVHSRDRRLQAERSGDRPLPAITCKRESLLLLPVERYRHSSDALEEGFRKAGKFLNERMILWQRDVPYPAQLVALATTFATLGSKAETVAAKDRLARWFWRVALAEDFGSATESKLAKDTPELIGWLDGGPEPERLDRLGFSANRLESLRSRLSAAYKAISALLMAQGCRDFARGDAASLMTFHNDPMDIHHIFPKAWCQGKELVEAQYDSIINKTPLTAASNREIGGRAPSEYLARIERAQNLSPAQLDEILRSHLIEPRFLRADDFVGFYTDRKSRLAGMIGSAIGRTIADVAPQTEAMVELTDQDPTEEAA